MFWNNLQKKKDVQDNSNDNQTPMEEIQVQYVDVGVVDDNQQPLSASQPLRNQQRMSFEDCVGDAPLFQQQPQQSLPSGEYFSTTAAHPSSSAPLSQFSAAGAGSVVFQHLNQESHDSGNTMTTLQPATVDVITSDWPTQHSAASMTASNMPIEIKHSENISTVAIPVCSHAKCKAANNANSSAIDDSDEDGGNLQVRVQVSCSRYNNLISVQVLKPVNIIKFCHQLLFSKQYECTLLSLFSLFPLNFYLLSGQDVSLSRA